MKRTDRGGLRLRGLLMDEDAVSPVIGVILMVAITVILAAVIGTFTLGLYEGGNEAAPVVDFDTEYDPSTPGTLNVTHVGGENIERNRLSWLVSGTPKPGVSFTGSGRIAAGDSATISGVSSTDTVLLVWKTVDEKRSATIMQWDGPDA